MRKVLIANLALAFAVGAPAAVMAASGRLSSPGEFSSSLDLQACKWTTSTVTTSSTTLQPIPSLSGLNS